MREPAMQPAAPLLAVDGLRKDFPVRRRGVGGMFGARRFVHAVNGVSFALGHEETFAIVGESGSGKSTTGRMIARLIEPTAGSIAFDGADWLALRGGELRRARRHVQMMFQNPFSSLDPRWSVERIVAEPLVAHRLVPATRMRERVVELLSAVGLGAQHLQRYPHQFSGGQRQRIGLARALASQPRLLVADEPVSALDVSVQAQVLTLLREIRARHRLGMVFISHDLSVVRYISDRVGIMYLGELVEIGPTAEVFRRPRHPYTAALLASAPRPEPGQRSIRVPLKGEIPSPLDLPAGCPFHPRCPVAGTRCATDKPPLVADSKHRSVACHYPERAAEVRGQGAIARAAPVPP
jgi:oligopeptide/dipeptide ABC transporter ATP-binding protein